jgi:hypothetical protein
VDPARTGKKLVNDGYSVTERETVYVAMYTQSVRQTNIYLSEAQQQAVDARATVEACTRSDIVRSVLDRDLNLGSRVPVGLTIDSKGSVRHGV